MPLQNFFTEPLALVKRRLFSKAMLFHCPVAIIEVIRQRHFYCAFLRSQVDMQAEAARFCYKPHHDFSVLQVCSFEPNILTPFSGHKNGAADFTAVQFHYCCKQEKMSF